MRIMSTTSKTIALMRMYFAALDDADCSDKSPIPSQISICCLGAYPYLLQLSTVKNMREAADAFSFMDF